MKNSLLFIAFVVISLSAFGQTEWQGPLPPPGLAPMNLCDDNNDGFQTFDLATFYEFIFYEQVFGVRPEDYHPTTFYLTQEDRDNETNPIPNPSAYVNISNPQKIYYRANAINPTGTYDVLKYANSISVFPIPEANYLEPLKLCDTDSDGFETFDLTLKNVEIIGDQTDIEVSFYITEEDAENKTNVIVNATSYTNISNPQTIYARVEFAETECYIINYLDLEVLESPCSDVAVYLTSQEAPRPGFDYKNRLTVKNIGTEPIGSGTVAFDHDTLLTFLSVSSPSTGNTIDITANGFSLNFDGLNPGEEEVLDITLNLPASTALGILLTNAATYTGSDNVAINNIYRLSETVVGSYDPNDIKEAHGPKIKFDEFTSNDYLFYTIRFQNVGTADAINVRIENTLDAQLDETTFQLLNTSHSNSLKRVGTKLTWSFDNIHLPSETMDEPASHGFVLYKIKPRPGFSIGDIIPNTAAIYFDFNAPVITNTFETEFEETLSVTKYLDEQFSVSPNPASSYVNIDLKKSIPNSGIFKVFNLQGKLVLQQEILKQRTELDVSNFSKGLYFIKMFTPDGVFVKKVVVK